MKKSVALLLVLVMILSLCACGGGKKYYGEFNTIDEGKLTVVTCPDFAPCVFYAIDETGELQLVGFDLALAAYIADYLALELAVIPTDFDGVLSALQSGSVDIGLAGISPDAKREAAMDFSDLYYLGGQSFVCLEENKDLFPDLAAANKPEYTIGAQDGSIQFGLAEEFTPNAKIVSLSKAPDAIPALLDGELDAAFIETAVAESYRINYPELCPVLTVPYEEAGFAAAVRKGNTELLEGVNEAIAAALEDGSMDRFVAEANQLAAGRKHEGLLSDYTG